MRRQFGQVSLVSALVSPQRPWAWRSPDCSWRGGHSLANTDICPPCTLSSQQTVHILRRGQTVDSESGREHPWQKLNISCRHLTWFIKTFNCGLYHTHTPQRLLGQSRYIPVTWGRILGSKSKTLGEEPLEMLRLSGARSSVHWGLWFRHKNDCVFELWVQSR